MTNLHNSREEQCEWAALHALGGLSPDEEAAYQAHLETGCRVCGLEFASFDEVAGQLGLACSPVRPPPLLRRRLLARIATSEALAEKADETAPAPGNVAQRIGDRVVVFGDRKVGVRERSPGQGAEEPRGVRGIAAGWAVAAAVILMLGLGGWSGLHWWTRSSQPGIATQEAFIDSLYAQVNAIIKVGLGDHVHCTVFRDLEETPPSFEQMAENMGPDYIGLAPLIEEKAPRGFRIIQAHQCDYRGRKFVHVALAGDAKLVSLVVTRKSPGESFSNGDMIPVLEEAGVPIYRAGVDAFEIAGFESDDHLVFVASDLSEGNNLQLAVNLAPAVRELLEEIEG